MHLDNNYIRRNAYVSSHSRHRRRQRRMRMIVGFLILLILAAAIEAFGEDGLYSEDPSYEAFKFQKFLTYYVLYSKETLNVTVPQNATVIINGNSQQISAGTHTFRR